MAWETCTSVREAVAESAEQLSQQLQEVRDELEELALAERVARRLAEQVDGEREGMPPRAAADTPVMVKQGCGELGMSSEPTRPEALRSKLNRLAERGWLRKPADGKVTTTL